MKAVLLTALRRLEIANVPKPSIQNDTDVLLRIKRVGVCGSDVHYFEEGKIGSQIVKYPFIIGHECSAVVEAVGSAVTKVKLGEQVVVDPAASCNDCDQCRMGRENTCRNLCFLGTPGQSSGCLCEFIVMPQDSCLPTNGQIGLDEAALCEPFTISYYSVMQSQTVKGNKIAILGSGPIGLGCLTVAKSLGINKIYMTDKIDDRLKVAKERGAIWSANPQRQNIAKEIAKEEPLGLDAVLECAGQQSTLDEALEILRPGGKLIMVGIPRFERVSFIIDLLRRKEITVINIRRQNRCTQKALDLLASGKVDISFMVTHRFPVDRVIQAFELVRQYSDGVIKAMIEF